jgi:hypothetical protein
MRIPLASVLVAGSLAALGAVPAAADTVYLTNGKSFDGVVAESGDSQVRIQMPGGEIRLPKASVERVEQSDSAFAEYLHRKQSLGRTASAADWLALARWARAHGLDQGEREAALKAARLDPHLEGLSTILRGYGYVYDRDLDRYISSDEAMRRQGFVQSSGRWITREEQAELRRSNEELQAAEASRAASEAQRQLAEAQLYQQQAVLQGGASPYYPTFGTTLGVFPGFFPPVVFPHPGHGHGRSFPGSGGHRSVFGSPMRGNAGFQGLAGRVPGSLFPVNPPARRR